MKPSAFHRRLVVVPGVLAVVGLCLSGCRDDDGDPMAVLAAAETHGALRVAEGLPTMGDLAYRAGGGQEMAEAEVLWTQS